MADPEQVKILLQGVDRWNQWRSEHPRTKIDLSEVDLRRVGVRGANISEAEFNGADLREADLSEARLRGAFLEGADLDRADLSKADLSGAFLSEARLQGAELWAANLRSAILHKADLRDASLPIADLGNTSLDEADLRGANLSRANLRGTSLNNTDLRGADLRGANLAEAFLWRTDLRTARMGYTLLPDVDLQQAIGLEEALHFYPSALDIDTMRRSKGKIPEAFLRGCGLSDWEIESAKLYDPDLSRREVNKALNRMQSFRLGQHLQVSPLYVSYSDADRGFVDTLEQHLNSKGIRFWHYRHEAGAGPVKQQVERDYRDQTVILVLSTNSIPSDWLQDELRRAKDCEVPGHVGRYVFRPVALDESWETGPWPAPLLAHLRGHDIPDFAGWQDDPGAGDKIEELITSLDLY